MKKDKLKVNNKRKIYRNGGITLIALVITIIVLLILAGVTIATLAGDNGILTKATESKNKTEESEEKEKIELSVVGALAKDNGGEIKEKYLDEELSNNFGERGKDYTLEGTGPYIVTIEKSGRKYVVNKDGSEEEYLPISGNYYETETEIVVGGKPVTIPGGAQISGIDGEYESIDEGLVIYITNGNLITDWSDIETIQKSYDQFVWVPVENAYLDLTGKTEILESDDNVKLEVQKEIDIGKYPMAIKNGEDYYGVLYQFTEENDKVKIELLEDEGYGDVAWTPISKTGGREPDVIREGYDNDNIESNLNQINQILNTKYKTSDELQADLQIDFNEMINSVAKNGGFWVGRYETSNMNLNQITVIKGTTKGINNINWYRMYAKQKEYSSQELIKTEKVKSNMIWGSQWDQIMIWMKEVKNNINQTEGKYYITNSIGMGNYDYGEADPDDVNLGPVETGNRIEYRVKNIYDLSGNVFDTTMEANNGSDGLRSIRGACYYYANPYYCKTASRDIFSGISDGCEDYGSRITIY